MVGDCELKVSILSLLSELKLRKYFRRHSYLLLRPKISPLLSLADSAENILNKTRKRRSTANIKQSYVEMLVVVNEDLVSRFH